MKRQLIESMRDRINENGYSYAAHAAMTGNDSLLMQGVEASSLAVYQAIYGYAVAGNITAIQKLLSAGADEPTAMKMLVRGLVRGNHLEALYKIKDHNHYKEDIVIGYAQANHKDMVARLVNKEPALLFKAAVQGYASAGHSEPLIDLLCGTRFYGEAIFHAAKAGHVALVNQLMLNLGCVEDLSQVTEKERIRCLGFLNKALSGYCEGYHLEAAGDLLQKGGNILVALNALKITGRPSLEGYTGLFLATSDETSAALLKEMLVEYDLVVEAGGSPFPQKVVKKLRKEFQDSSATLVSFLSDGPSKGVTVFEALDHYLYPAMTLEK